MAKGFLIKKIADQLGVSFATVRAYTQRIYEKLHLRSRSQATAHFFRIHR